MNNWQPIETAPKDGIRILLAFSDHIEVGVFENAILYDLTMEVLNEFGAPTHWQTLPEPTKERN